ncbi:MAG: hypothetical protein K4571_19045 [Deltaproteobacteria bacterium]
MKEALAFFASIIFLYSLSAGTAFAQSAGKAIVDSACSQCHSTGKIHNANKKPAEWQATLDRMIHKGAKIKPEEKNTVLKYLMTLNK